MSSFRYVILTLLLTATAQALAAGSVDKPSRAATKGCAWEKLTDSSVGLDAWVERCEYESRKIDFVFNGHALAQRYDAGNADPLVEVLDLRAGEAIEAGLARLFGEHTDKTLAAKCLLKPYKYYKPNPRGVKRYTFVPNAQYQKKVDAEQSPDEVGEPACGDWGDAPDGIQYFEVQANSVAAQRVLFVRVGQDEPLFDEQTLKILPAK